MVDTVYDKILRGEIKSYKVWEDEKHLAFLTPYPNTPGFTLVIPKINPGNYVFSLKDDEYHELLGAAKTVARILEKALDIKRVALVFEGTGVPHVHAKLIPLYGELANRTHVWSKDIEFTEEYHGHITTAEGPMMDSRRLAEIQEKIVAAQES